MESEDLARLEAAGLKLLKGIKDVELDPSEVNQLYGIENVLEMSRAKREVVVESLRRQRGEYVTKKKAAPRKPKKAPAEIEGLKLEDLDLSLEDILKK